MPFVDKPTGYVELLRQERFFSSRVCTRAKLALPLMCWTANHLIDDSWEEIVEVSFTPSTQKVILSEWGGTYVCDIPILQKTYRVRYCARDMALGNEVDTNVEDQPVDFYCLVFWPAAPAPDALVKQTSQVAAYWHNWVQTSNL